MPESCETVLPLQVADALPCEGLRPVMLHHAACKRFQPWVSSWSSSLPSLFYLSLEVSLSDVPAIRHVASQTLMGQSPGNIAHAEVEAAELKQAAAQTTVAPNKGAGHLWDKEQSA